MKSLPLVFHPDYEMNIGPHVFPTDKYRLAYELLRREGWAGAENVLRPEEAPDEALLRVHTAEYLDDLRRLRVTSRTAYSELPLDEAIVRGFRLMTGGSILAARLALERGAAMHLGGGFHHAFADHAEGFCYINDIAVAIRAMAAEGLIRRAAVIDLDLHQGNGTAHIFKDDPGVLTFSMHQEWLYPQKEESDIDIGLHNYIEDEEYLEKLAGVVPRRIAEFGPDLVIYAAGADPYEDDQLGDLKLSMEGLRRRDRWVTEACHKAGWPLAVVTAGGYARDRRDTARIHANTAVEVARAWGMGRV